MGIILSRIYDKCLACEDNEYNCEMCYYGYDRYGTNIYFKLLKDINHNITKK